MSFEGEVKQIPILGIERSGADSVCTDGAMNEVIGLEYKDGSFVPYKAVESKLPSGITQKIIRVHKTSYGENRILISANGSMSWMKGSEWGSSSETTAITGVSGITDIEFVGNYICVVNEEGMHYFLFDGTNYVYSKQFDDDYRCSVRVTHGFLNKENQRIYGAYTLYPYEYTTKDTNVINKLMASQLVKSKGAATEFGGLTGVFLVSTAFRRKDGSLTNVSCPILMSYPLSLMDDRFKYFNDSGGITENAVKNLCISEVNYVSLMNISIEETKEITCEFTSGGYKEFGYAYNKSASGTEYVEHRINTPFISHVTSHGHTVAGEQVAVTHYNIESSYQANGLQFRVKKPSGESDIESVCIFISREVNIFSDFTDELSKYNITDRLAMKSWYPKMRDYEQIAKDIKSLDRLYLVGEKQISDLDFDESGEETDWIDLDLRGKLGSNLIVRESLPITDFYEWMYKGQLKTYNSRLNIFGAKSKQRNFTFQDTVMYGEAGELQPQPQEGISENIIIIQNCKRSDGSLYSLVSTEPNKSYSTIPPLLFFYKDAYEAYILIGRDRTYYGKYLALRKSSTFDLSYWESGTLKPVNIDIEHPMQKPLTPVLNFYGSDNNIVVSETYAPKVFEEKNTYTIGDGKIIAMASLAIAMSQDQFGDYPILAFCTDGIYSIEVDKSGNGAYSQTHPPFSREVCVNKNSICEVDGAVLFASDKGLMMATVNNAQPFAIKINGEPKHLPQDSIDTKGQGLKVYGRIVNNNKIVLAKNIISHNDFIEFITSEKAHVEYVSPKNKIVVYNTDYPYCYWIDIPTRNITKLPYAIQSSDGNYPTQEFYHFTTGLLRINDVFKFNYLSESGSQICVLQSRPIRIDNGLKTGYRVVLRGYFEYLSSTSAPAGQSRAMSIGGEIINIPDGTTTDDNGLNTNGGGSAGTGDNDKQPSNGGLESEIGKGEGNTGSQEQETPSETPAETIDKWAELVVLGSVDGEHWQTIGFKEKKISDGPFHDFGCETFRVSCNYVMIIFASALSHNSHIDGIEMSVIGKYNNKLK